MNMIERVLGKGGLKVSAVGLGCMGMSEFYDPAQMDDAESIRVIHRFLDAGGDFLDTADMYGRQSAGQSGQSVSVHFSPVLAGPAARPWHRRQPQQRRLGLRPRRRT